MLIPISYTETILMDSVEDMRKETLRAIFSIDKSPGRFSIPRPSKSAKRLWVERELAKVGCKYGD
ncbi:hypothetical protein IV02_15205 [Pseudomonas syringae]|uniref:Uncharacterized protein n=1 Tax=Pseudomonas syringae TaxID=317 RepID=A0A085V5Q9_PSESX|nr:hypothetical protein IV02_15205 [Pseudomonas syringae]